MTLTQEDRIATAPLNSKSLWDYRATTMKLQAADYIEIRMSNGTVWVAKDRNGGTTGYRESK